MHGDHLKLQFPTQSYKCWYGISAKTAGTALQKLQANILLLPTYIALIDTREWKRQQEKRCQQWHNPTEGRSWDLTWERQLQTSSPARCTTWPSHPHGPATEAGHVEEPFSSKCYRCLMHQAQPCQGLHVYFEHFSNTRKQKKNIMYENWDHYQWSQQGKQRTITDVRWE